MDFRIADTFTESLARLTGDEQKAVKTTAFDLQINPASPGMNFHRLAKSRGRGAGRQRAAAALRRRLRHRRPDALFFAGDLGQRIFQLPFSWKSLGVDVRGRSATLRINYRTSHQIRVQAGRLFGKQISDVDGNVEDRSRLRIWMPACLTRHSER